MKNKEILDSWKAIAAYLERDIKTCYRWEKELGLPVHRIDDKSSRSKVFAYTSEIDLWLREKAVGAEDLGRSTATNKRKIRRLVTTGILTTAVFVIFYFSFFKVRSPIFSAKSSAFQDIPVAFEEIEAFQNLGSVSSIDKSSILKRIDDGGLKPWQLYHQGMYYLDQNIQESNELAIILFLRVINSAESLPLAFLGLAQCYINNVVFTWKLEKEWLDKAEDLVVKAGNESKKYPEYYSVAAEIKLLKAVYFNENTLPSSQKFINTGIEVFPNHPRLNSIAGDFHYLSYGKSGNTQDFDQALKFKEKAFWLKPYSLNNVEYAELLMLEKNFHAAAQVCEQILNIDPTMMAKFRLGEIHYYSGSLNKSEEIFNQFTTPLSLKIASLYYRGMIAARKGQRETIESVIREIDLLSIRKRPFGFDRLRAASMYFGLKDECTGYKYLQSFFSDIESNKLKFIGKKYIELDLNFDSYKDQDKFKQTTFSE